MTVCRRRCLAVVAAGAAWMTACTGSGAPREHGAATLPAERQEESIPPSTDAPTTSASSATSVTTTSTTSVPARSYDFSPIDPIVTQFLDEHDLAGAGLVVVERTDGIVYERYWGDFGPDRISLIASASKMLVAGVLLRLDDRGLLDIDAPVADAVGWGTGNPGVTPAQLMSNSSGLVGLVPNPSYAPYICQYLPVGELQECAKQIFTTADDDADVVAPDTEFRYGGAQWQVAGAVAEAVSGLSWAELVDETYVQTCGADSLGFANQWSELGSFDFSYPTGFTGDPGVLTATANPNMEGGAYITAPDYARLLLMHLRDGRCGETQVLSPDALARMHADRIGEVYGGSAGAGGYGMGWWVDRATGRLTDPGAYGAVPWLDLDDGHGAYLVLEADGIAGGTLASMLFDPVAAAIAAGRGG